MMSLAAFTGLSVTMKVIIVVGVVLLVLGLIRKAKRLITIGLIVAIVACLANGGLAYLQSFIPTIMI